MGTFSFVWDAPWDWIIVVFLLIMLLRGKARGFLEAFITSAASILGLLGGYFFSEPVGAWLCDKTNFNNLFRNMMDKQFLNSWKTAIESGASSAQDFQSGIIESMNDSIFGRFIGEVQGIDFASSSQDIFSTMQTTLYGIADNFAMSIAVAIAFLLIIFLIRLILGKIIVGIFLPIVTKISLVKGVDSLLGAVFGLLKGSVTVVVVCLVVMLLGSTFVPVLADTINANTCGIYGLIVSLVSNISLF